MKWFKHYSNAHVSESLENLINEFGFEGYGRYWRLLEYLGSLYDGESHSFRIHKRSLRDCLRFKSALKTDNYLVAIGLQRGYEVHITETHYEIEAPILAELQSRDFKKARTDRAPTAPKNKIKNKIKNKNNIKANQDLPERVDFEFYSNCWNILVGEKLPQVKTLSDPRKRALKSHIGKNKNFHAEFEDFVKKVLDSDFLCGATTSFVASFDWCLKPANYIKIIEDNYKNKTANANNSIDNLELN